jgi:hypothetical protein
MMSEPQVYPENSKSFCFASTDIVYNGEPSLALDETCQKNHHISTYTTDKTFKVPGGMKKR